MCLYQAVTHFSKLDWAKSNRARGGLKTMKKYILKIRYGCQHPRNCSPEPMMDKGHCTFEE